MRMAKTMMATPSSYAAWLQRLGEQPYRFNFYHSLRKIEASHPHLPRLGEAKRPADEPVRVAQPADLTFAPSAIHSLQMAANGVPRLQQRIFGLLGPNGPLPVHLTELTRERIKHHADPTLQRFLDTFTHRFALMFYRAWAQAQPTLGLDRPGDDPFARRLGTLAGLAHGGATDPDAVGERAKLHFIGRLARQVRDADGLRAWCRSEFDVPLAIEEWRGHWLLLDREERTRLGSGRRSAFAAGLGLGQGAVLGAAAWDVQHKFRIVIGPLSLASYQHFLPGGRDLPRLQAMVRQWLGLELEWDLNLILAGAEVPAIQLQRSDEPNRMGCSLGRTAWLVQHPAQLDRKDLVLDVDRVLRQHRRRANAGPAHPAQHALNTTPRGIHHE